MMVFLVLDGQRNEAAGSQYTSESRCFILACFIDELFIYRRRSQPPSYTALHRP
jgi:hypothetical protein